MDIECRQKVGWGGVDGKKSEEKVNRSGQKYAMKLWKRKILQGVGYFLGVRTGRLPEI